MVGLFSGEKESVYEVDEYVAGEMGTGKWVRKGDYKAVKIAPPYGDNVWRLYNVSNDPGETTSKEGEYPELLNELKVAWDKYSKEVGVVLEEK